ncbi:MAG: flagellar biosynthesis protein FlhA [Candidatus Lambdaproteobacteria bacterium RIFOXYD2_FULL_50_16]|uniref:Flagellar biosynthesis protein FlhA n=1 Tax=Candidatus Lambdaproteobacteria bacterium RIFOXYD2_FULL_50_16 TaxID=1817772 RepID=A0A1F6G7B0_9PROT|nr:MAG: flagellar biosynthesis protein FlhA [Candidatus Lambdaproteobacteria bacterium RIFOXYD2_FULL_50_16]
MALSIPGAASAQSSKKLFLGPDIILAFSIILILAVMILPLPAILLDILFAVNITFAVLILFVALYSLKPLDFSIFPSILLVTTLFRLSLNVASTRAILTNGKQGTSAAGNVIQAFGSYVVGGNYLIGIIVFLILVLINFIVITKGSGRIAEVAARFTLDAMPGKQMAIDADLNAGIINESEATRRRRDIQREADFFGAMDGASKFVRGDAIAGLIITGINVVGGLVLGVLTYNMEIGVAAQTFTSLTIGDGLVSQIPALIISIAAGMVITKAGAQNRLGVDFGLQLFGNPFALGLAAGTLVLFAMVPGMPKPTFLILGALVGFVAWKAKETREQAAMTRQTAIQMEEMAKVEDAGEAIVDLLPIDTLGLELGYAMIPLVDADQDGELLERVKAIRRQVALDLGFVVPPVHIKDNLQLEPGAYSIVIKGIEVGKGEMMIDHYLAMQAGEVDEEMDGIATTEPAFGLPAIWISEADKERAQIAGYTVVDIPTVISTHLTEVIRSHAGEFLGRQDVQKLLDKIAAHEPKLVEELVPDLLGLGTVQRVLQALLKENVSIRDMNTIMEILADTAQYTKVPELLVEHVREGLARSITRQYQNDKGVVPVMTLSQEMENMIVGSIQDTGQGTFLGLSPEQAGAIIGAIEQGIESFSLYNYQPVLLTGPQARIQVKRLTERAVPNLTVLSHNEIAQEVQVESLGQVEFNG